jgi:hypothetical protein
LPLPLVAFSIALLGALVVGCSAGGYGDVGPSVEGNVLGAGRTLASLNDVANPRPGLNEQLAITGVRVSHVDNYDETKSGAVGGVFLQDFTDVPLPYQGILAYQASYSPPSFRVASGDVVDATGQYQEFIPNVAFLKQDKPNFTTPEMVGPNLKLRFDAPYRPLIPAEINVDDLFAYGTGRPWISMLVVVRNVKVFKAGTQDSAGRFTIPLQVSLPDPNIADLPIITNELFDLASVAVPLDTDVTIASVTGIVTLFSSFHIAPRSPDDIKLQ